VRVHVPGKSSLFHHTGTYLSLAAGVATIGVAGDELTLEREGEVARLRPIDQNLFVSEDGEVEIGFVPEAAGPAPYFMLDEHAYGRLELETLPKLPLTVLETFAGQYRFDDGDTVSIWVEDGALQASFSWLDGCHRCTPLSESRFSCCHGLLEFRPDADGSLLLAYAGFVMARRMANG
jgi:hypothetical protein